MQVARSMIGVDMAGIYCGDTDLAMAAAKECDSVYNALFGSPIRRARQLGAGKGVIVDCDDGQYEIVVDFDRDSSRTTPVSGLRETFFDVELFLNVASGIVTVCDTLCFAKPKSAFAGEAEWLEPLHFVRVSIPPGTYLVKLTGYSRAAGADDEQVSRRVFSKEDHEAWWEANRAYIRGDLPKPDFEAEKNRLQSRTYAVVDGIALSFAPVERIPAEYDPGDVVLELGAKQAASKMLEGRRGAK